MLETFDLPTTDTRKPLTPGRAPPRSAGSFRLPGARDRLAVMGRTGSGKTHFASWVLSRANWPRIPWVLVDYKRDEMINSLPRLEEIGLSEKIPKHPGLYVVHPRPDEIEAVESLLWKIWRKERTGLYVDEGHILPDQGALQALLTQGRSKSIPAIVLTQRPVKINRFVISEADFYSIFHLNDRRDRKTIGEYVPIDLERPLKTHHSWYYDIGRNQAFHMLPVPDTSSILDAFDERSNRTRWKKV